MMSREPEIIRVEKERDTLRALMHLVFPLARQHGGFVEFVKRDIPTIHLIMDIPEGMKIIGSVSPLHRRLSGETTPTGTFLISSFSYYKNNSSRCWEGSGFECSLPRDKNQMLALLSESIAKLCEDLIQSKIINVPRDYLTKLRSELLA